LEFPRLRRAFQSFKEAGARANWLHIAGPVQPILSYYEPAGVSIANFDYCVSPAEAQRALPKTCLDGNVRPVAFIDSTPAEIRSQSKYLLDAFRDRGGFILSSGCEIPPESVPETIAALVSSASGEE
jgi:uroporphyrinogen decarboxylase